VADLSEVTRDLGAKPHGMAGQSILPKSAMPYGNCPVCIIRKEDAESMAAALNEKFPGVNHLVIDLDYMPSQERDPIGT
jgi:hypothetical protein